MDVKENPMNLHQETAVEAIKILRQYNDVLEKTYTNLSALEVLVELTPGFTSDVMLVGIAETKQLLVDVTSECTESVGKMIEKLTSQR